MLRTNIRHFLGAAVAVALVAGCGGGGGDPGAPPFGDGGGQVSRVELVLDKQSMVNTGLDTVVATATAVGGNGQGLPGVTVTFEVDGNTVFTQDSATTDESGISRATVRIGADKSNRVVTVRARSGGQSASAVFVVTGSTLLGTAIPQIVAPGSVGNAIDFRLVDSNNDPIVGQSISVSAPGLPSANGSTGTSGQFRYTYNAPAQVGSINVTATAGGVTNTQLITVQSETGAVPPVTVPVLSASVSADPRVVPVNTGDTDNRAEVRALFVGPGNAAVRNVRVRFDLGGDPNGVGGEFLAGSSLVYSDANGIAVTAYRPGSRSSPTDGVIIRACYDVNDFPAGSCPNQATATLTVVSEPLGVTIGTNELILSGDANLTYIKEFVVLVVDSAGRAQSNVLVTPSLDLPWYMKGFYSFGESWGQNVTAFCPNEDVNRNGVLETGEDRNANGQLDPRRSDVAVSMIDGIARTNESGLAFLQIEYPRNVASWLNVDIKIAATGVAGTEGRMTFNLTLPVPAAVLNNQDVTPAFVVSPYGVQDGVPDAQGFCTNRF